MDNRTAKRRRESTGAHQGKLPDSCPSKRGHDESTDGRSRGAHGDIGQREGGGSKTCEGCEIAEQDEGSSSGPSGGHQSPHRGQQHSFDTNVLDHCETPRAAYEHLREFLDVLGQSMKISTSSMRVWDPYYCDGAVKRIFTEMGFDNIIHECGLLPTHRKQHEYPSARGTSDQPPLQRRSYSSSAGICGRNGNSQSTPRLLAAPQLGIPPTGLRGTFRESCRAKAA